MNYYIDFFNSLDNLKYNNNNPYAKALINKRSGLEVKEFDIEKDYKKMLKTLKDDKLINFLAICKNAYIIPLEFLDEFFGFQVRGKNVKKFYNLVFNNKYPTCYGFYDFFDYDYNKPIILVEGIKDLYTIKYFYKYVVAYLTSKINKELYKFLLNITKKIYIILDNDRAGRQGLFKEEYKGFNKFLLYKKDAGEFFDTGDKEILFQVRSIVDEFIKEV